MARSDSSRDLSRLLTIVVAVVVIAVLYLARVVVLPLALAILFAFLVSPAVRLLEKIRVPRILAILSVILIIFAFVCAIGWAVSAQLVQIAAQLPAYRANITAKIAEVHNTNSGSLSRAETEVERLGRELGLSSSSNERGETKPVGSPGRPVSVKEVQSSNSNTLGALHGVLRGVLEALLVVVFTFFMLLQREDLRNRLIRLTGPGELSSKTQAMDEASGRISRYFILLLTVNATYGLVIFIALHFIGLPHAWLFGALTVLLRFIPYIGAPISALLPIALALAAFPGWEQALIVLGIFLCVEIVTANYIEPRLYGKHTGLSPLAILVAAVFWTLIWGPIGLILSVPLTVCVAVIGGHVPSLKFLNLLVGDQPVLQPPAHYYQRLLAGDDHEAGQIFEGYLKEKSIEELYDSVLVPALGMAERDRHANQLDNATAVFISQTTKELVEEWGLQRDAPPALEGTSETAPSSVEKTAGMPSSAKILCMPVRDDADEIIAIMLAQLLERAGHRAEAVALGGLDRMIAEVSKEKPDAVYLSALPPYAQSHTRGLYRSLRGQYPHLMIVIDLWNYPGDPLKAAQTISGGEQEKICTTLAEAVSQAGSFSH